MKKSISRSSSIRSIASFRFVTRFDTLERARVYYSYSKRGYYLAYSYLHRHYLILPLGGPDDFRDDLEVLVFAAHFTHKYLQNPLLCLNS